MGNKKTAVLDIQSDTITLVMQDKKFSDSFSFHDSRSYSGFQNGEFLNKDELIGAVRSLIDRCRKTTFSDPEEIMVGVPAEFTLATVAEKEVDFSLPRKVTEKDVDDLISEPPASNAEYTVISAAPVWFIPDSGMAEITPYGITTTKLKCMMSYVYCVNSFIALFDKISEYAGVRFEYMSDMLSEVMYVVPEHMRDAGALVVDAGYISTGIAYAYGDGILGLKSFSMGKGHIAAELTMQTGIPYDIALKLVDKLNFNLHPVGGEKYFVTADDGANKEYDISKINEMAAAKVEDIARSIVTAAAAFPFALPDDAKIILTGSCFENMPGAKEIIERVTGREVEKAVPDIVPFNRPGYAALAGLINAQRKKITRREGAMGFINTIKDKLLRRLGK